jgi:hypothetical protein
MVAQSSGKWSKHQTVRFVITASCKDQICLKMTHSDACDAGVHGLSNSSQDINQSAQWTRLSAMALTKLCIVGAW